MYSIVIAIFFYILGVWLLAHEYKKDPARRSAWSLLSSILSLIMGVAVTLVWLVTVFL